MTRVSPPPIRPRRSLDQQIAYQADQVALAKRHHPDWPELAETMQAILETLLMVRDLATDPRQYEERK